MRSQVLPRRETEEILLPYDRQKGFPKYDKKRSYQQKKIIIMAIHNHRMSNLKEKREIILPYNRHEAITRIYEKQS